MWMRKSPSPERKSCENNTGTDTKTRTRNPVATPRSKRALEKAACLSSENGSGQSAFVPKPKDRGADGLSTSLLAGNVSRKGTVGSSGPGLLYRGSEQESVSSPGTRDSRPGSTGSISGVSVSPVLVNHRQI